MTYPAIKDNGYTGYPRQYYKCIICGIICRHLSRHMNKQHKEVIEY